MPIKISMIHKKKLKLLIQNSKKIKPFLKQKKKSSHLAIQVVQKIAAQKKIKDHKEKIKLAKKKIIKS